MSFSRPLLRVVLAGVAVCGLLAAERDAGRAGARAAEPASRRSVSACETGPGDASAWQPVETPALAFCVPPGWAAMPVPRGAATGRWRGPDGWAEWWVGPFPLALPPERPERGRGKGDWAPRADRPAETYVTWDASGVSGRTHWPATDDAPAVVLRTEGAAGDTSGSLHGAILGTVRFRGAHARPPRGYFPGDVLSPGDPRGAQFRDGWYSRHLRAMGEPRLVELAAGADQEVLRLTVLPSFSPAFAVRLHRRGPGAVMVATVLSGAGGYEPGEVARRDSVAVDDARATAFFRRADSVGFWRMPTRASDLGFDGSQWILEGVRGGRHHVVDRWTPESTGNHPVFLNLAQELLRLGGRSCTDR